MVGEAVGGIYLTLPYLPAHRIVEATYPQPGYVTSQPSRWYRWQAYFKGRVQHPSQDIRVNLHSLAFLVERDVQHRVVYAIGVG